MSGLADLSLELVSAAIRRGEVSPVEATHACLERIAERDGELRAFITLTAESAMEEARARQEELAAGQWRGPLHGVPLALKDLFATAGVLTTGGSAILGDWVPSQDATVVRKLRDAGAVLLGKLNMHEFAYGATGENPHYGTVRNPASVERLAGGSSSGSAAAVAAHFCYGALGSDTGGSIRCPAGLCGIVGLKPTYGRVSRTGVLPLAWSLDHVGPMTRTVPDAALMLEAIAGHDPEDGTSSRRPVPKWREELGEDVRGLRLAVPKEWFWEAVHPSVARRTRAAVEGLARLGAEVEEVSLPTLEWANSPQTLIIHAEATAYHRATMRERLHDYGPSVQERLLEGLFVTGADYVDALRARRVVLRELLGCLEKFDALLTSTVPIPAPRVGQEIVDAGPVSAPPQFFMVRHTFLFNLTGLPAITVPCGRVDGLPVGLQIAGRPWDETTVLRIARAWEVGG